MPQKRGKWWVIQVRQDVCAGGKRKRVNKRVRLALIADTPERQARKLAAEHLRPMNQGLQSIGAATNFEHFVENTYKPVVMPTFATTTRGRTDGVIKNYLIPTFGKASLGDITKMEIQRYLSGLAHSTKLGHQSRDKIRDVLSSILASAVEYDLLSRNPVDGVRLPACKTGRRQKPHVTPEQFAALISAVPEPYATMMYVAVWTGLRVSELVGLRWNDVQADALTIDERYCRGDWGAPKSDASNATIGVAPGVIARIQRLKTLTVKVRAGRATRKYKVVKADGPDDLVFQSVREGRPMRDNNILVRFIKPAARKLGIGFVNWRCLRTSHATWMVEAGANPKDVQGQMRHSRISTTMDIYAQFVPDSQRRAIAKMSEMVTERTTAGKETAPAHSLEAARPITRVVQ